MTRAAYVNGQFVPPAIAAVHVEDRGNQFADAVYEVIMVLGGRLLDAEAHLDRLENSLGALGIEMPRSRPALGKILGEIVRRNRLRQGTIYLQISRGQAPRDHAFPAGPVRPTLVITAKPFDLAGLLERQKSGVGVVTTPEIRWRRCDVKSVSLLGNVLAKEEARKAGAYEAWFVDESGCVTEGSSSNAWIVAGNRLITRQLHQGILSGVTRASVVRLAEELQISIEERGFTVEEAKAADEAIVTSTTSFVTPAVRINDSRIGDGAVGPVTHRLIEAHFSEVENQLGVALSR